ncbi:MAG: 30S ribosomal protein S18 [Candidatus Gracilibacteria bacterium]
MPTYKGRRCHLCTEEVKYVDYKNLASIGRFITKFGKIVPKYYSGNCLKHQKMVANAIKRAREMALIPFIK